MREWQDLELRRPVADSGDRVEATRPPNSRWILAALLAVLLAAASYVVLRRQPLPPPEPDSVSRAAAVPAPPPARALGGQAEPIVLPPLDETDPLVRRLVRTISSHQSVVAWLATTGLIRNLTVVVWNIADGASPAKFLTVLRPSSGFRTVSGNGYRYIDPRSYDRYSAIGDAVASFDPAAVASLYATLKPRIRDAYQELGLPGSSLDRTLQAAIVALLETPTPEGRLLLRPKGIVYAYDDERLEGLTRAQKQLLRMGPRNVRIIKGKLRDIALALGIRASELPPD